jgi:hypothetical protein
MVPFFLAMLVVFIFITTAVIISTYLCAYSSMQRSRRGRRMNMTLSKAYRRRINASNVDMSTSARRVVGITCAFFIVAVVFIVCLISSVH